jgi:arylsulfatase A
MKVQWRGNDPERDKHTQWHDKESDMRRTTPIGMLALLLSAGLVGFTPPAHAQEGAARVKRPPNLVFIFADDLGLDGFSCYGSDQHKTPQIDALAAGGIRFETCYSTPLCGPSRCQLMTGRYPFRTGGLTNQTAGKPSSEKEVGIAKVLKQAGYATCQVGKWRQMSGTPNDWGFDESLSDGTASGHFWVTQYLQNGKPVQTDKKVYHPDVMHEFAMNFLGRNKDRPFFLYYSMHLVHSPIVATPDSVAESKTLYADNIAYMDKLVGKVVAELDRLGVREQTLVLFSVDNGTPNSKATIGGKKILGGKGSLKEGGSRVALIANWKGTTPAGKVSKDLVDFSDLFPTFAELAGAGAPEGVKLDGRSFAPQLRGQAGNPREWVFVQLGNGWYVRDARWKLTEKNALFDLNEAPFQEIPADDKDPAALAAQKRLKAVLDELKPAQP